MNIESGIKTADFLRVKDVSAAIEANRSSPWMRSVGSSSLAIGAGAGTGYGLAEALLYGADVAYTVFPTNDIANKTFELITANVEYVQWLPVASAMIGAIAVGITLYKKDSKAAAQEKSASEILGNDSNRFIDCHEVLMLKSLTKNEIWNGSLSKRTALSLPEIAQINEKLQNILKLVLSEIIAREKTDVKIYKNYRTQIEDTDAVAAETISTFLIKSLSEENLQRFFDFGTEVKLNDLTGACLNLQNRIKKDI